MLASTVEWKSGANLAGGGEVRQWFRFSAMSLNRNEQLLYDYLQAKPDERRHWEDVVRREEKRAEDRHAAALVLERDLRRYFAERAGVTEPFRGVAQREGLPSTSMRNLAELLLRLWCKPVPKSPDAPRVLPYA